MVHPDFNIASFTFESYLKEKRRKTRTAQNIRFQALPETSPALKTQILADVTVNYETAFSLLMYNVSYGARTLSFSRNILTTMTVPITVIYKNLTGLED